MVHRHRCIFGCSPLRHATPLSVTRQACGASIGNHLTCFSRGRSCLDEGGADVGEEGVGGVQAVGAGLLRRHPRPRAQLAVPRLRRSQRLLKRTAALTAPAPAEGSRKMVVQAACPGQGSLRLALLLGQR